MNRQVFDSRPVVVEYSLTPKGQAFRRVAEAIQEWADEWAQAPDTDISLKLSADELQVEFSPKN